MRKIENKMVEILDRKLEGNGAAQLAIQNKDARSLFAYAMEACVGIREQGGNNRGPLVQLIQETIGTAVREAWCMSLIQTCIAYAEVKTGLVSPIPPSEHCLTVWNETQWHQRVKYSPLRGAIAIWRHGTSAAGHTGMFLEKLSPRKWRGVEGNTEHGVAEGKIERDGGGVYQTERSWSGEGEMHLLGFLKPF